MLIVRISAFCPDNPVQAGKRHFFNVPGQYGLEVKLRFLMAIYKAEKISPATGLHGVCVGGTHHKRLIVEIHKFWDLCIF